MNKINKLAFIFITWYIKKYFGYAVKSEHFYDGGETILYTWSWTSSLEKAVRKKLKGESR